MIPTLAEQFEVVRTRFPGSTLEDQGQTHLVTIPRFPLPEGWTHFWCQVQFELPQHFPFAMPEHFWTDPGVRLSHGAMPQWVFTNRRPNLWLWGWKPQLWSPLRDTIRTYTGVILRRFYELS